jgi:hypothetical protein
MLKYLADADRVGPCILKWCYPPLVTALLAPSSSGAQEKKNEFNTIDG